MRGRASYGGTDGMYPEAGNAVQRAAAGPPKESTHASEAKLPRKEIAQLRGMHPDTLSRALATPAKRGAIDLTRGDVAVQDLALLKALSPRETVA